MKPMLKSKTRCCKFSKKIDTTISKDAIDVVHRPEVKVSRNGPERRSGKRIIASTAFRLEFLVGWYYDADATMAVPELY